MLQAAQLFKNIPERKHAGIFAHFFQDLDISQDGPEW